MYHVFRILGIFGIAAVFQLLHWRIMPLGVHTLVNIGLAGFAGTAAYGCVFFARYIWQKDIPERWLAPCFVTGAALGGYFFMKYATTLDQAPMYPQYIQDAAIIAGPLLGLMVLWLFFVEDSHTSPQRQPRAG